MGTSISVLLERKDQKIFSVSPKSSIYEAGRIMAEKKIGVVIMLEGNMVEGIFPVDYPRGISDPPESAQMLRSHSFEWYEKWHSKNKLLR